MMTWRFFTTEGCHLCDQAWALCQQAGIASRCERVEISDSAALVERYGIRIPVIADATGRRELGWPFTLEQLHQFIAQCEA